MERSTLYYLSVIFLFSSCQTTPKQTRQNEPIDSLQIQIQQLERQKDKDAEVYFELAQLYAQRKDTMKALEALKKAVAMDKQNVRYLERLGFLYYVQGKLDSARFYLWSAYQADSNDENILFYLGSTYAALKNGDSALFFHKKLLKKAPLSAEYHHALCTDYLIIKDLNKALFHCYTAYQLDTLHVKSMDLLFKIYLDLGEEDSALYFVDKLLTLNPQHPLGRFNLGLYYHRQAVQLRQQGKEEDARIAFAKAIRQYKWALRSDPTFAQAYYNRGYAYYELQNFSMALADFQAAAKYAPENPKTHFMLGSLYAYYKDTAAAIKHFRKALQLDPDYRAAQDALKSLIKK